MGVLACPQCKTNKYSNPALKLLVNVCGHSLCANCVDILFVRGSGACPQCATALRRANFRFQLFEDTFIEKEIEIRKKVLKDFNKTEDDFENLSSYNDYLEQIETIIYNLVNDIDVEETRKLIDNYRKENKEEIKRNRIKGKTGEQAYLERLLLEEEELREALQKEQQEEVTAARRVRQRREAYLDDLAVSESTVQQQPPSSTASALMAQQHAAQLHKSRAAYRAGVGRPVALTGNSAVADTTNLQEQEDKELTPEPYILLSEGPVVPRENDDLLQQHEELMSQRLPSDYFGGGFTSALACQRLLQDAYNSLFLLDTETTAAPMDIS